MKYKDFVNTQNLTINIENLLKRVEIKSELPNFFKNNPKYQSELDDFIRKDLNLQEYTNGHDLCNILSIAFERSFGNHKKPAGETIEETLNACYRFSDFEQTDLYKNLENWQSKEPVFKLLK